MGPRARNACLAAAAVAFALGALALPRPGRMEGFRGTDDRAKETISRIDPVYRPWFRSLWEPPGAEVECLLFGIQAAAGAGLLGFALGHRHGRRAVGSDA